MIKVLVIIFFFLALIPFSFGQESSTLKIYPTDDAYVARDANDPLDEQGLKDLHSGDLEFIKLWYAYNVTKNQEEIFTMGYLKFDLSNVDSLQVSSAKLQMKPYIIDQIGPVIAVNTYLAENRDWNELDLHFKNRPLWYEDIFTSVDISESGEWYAWDITDMIKQKGRKTLTLATVIDLVHYNNEEQVVFYSKDTKNIENAPFLEIKYDSVLSDTQDSITQFDQTLDQESVPFENGNDYKIGIIGGGIAAAVLGIGLLFYLSRQKSLRKPKFPTKKQLAKFVDPTKDPKNYILRYFNEPKYKAWFDKNYPDLTIYEAVGLSESEF